MNNYLNCCFLFLALSSCKGKTDDNDIGVVLHNDNHIPDKQANDYFDKGIKYVEHGDYDQAKNFFLKADQRCPNLPVVLNSIGNCYVVMHLPESGIPYYEKALKADSSFVKSYINLGNCLNNLKDFEKATQILYLGLARNSPYPIDRHMLFLNLASAYYYQHNKDKAVEMLDSITADPNHDQVFEQAVEFEKHINTP
jgi:tetratricopeptide (TPR) repeat protein